MSASDELSESEARRERLDAGMQYLQLMTRAFSTLRLTDRTAISDTLSSLTGSFFDCRHHLTLLVDPDTGEIDVGACEGFSADERAELLSAAGIRFWDYVMSEKAAHFVSGEELLIRWPDAPAPLRKGLACVAIDLLDAPVGVLAVADKLSAQDFSQEELTFLACASGLAAMAIANAWAYEEQDAARKLAEARAEQAAAEAKEKQRALAELDLKLAIIEQQQQAIVELSTPVLQLWEDVVAMPIIGVVDSRRGEEIMEKLLAEISGRRARYVILDITGAEAVDTRTADSFIKLARGAELLGATCVITGIQPAVAQTLVSIGADLSSLVTVANIGQGLRECIRRMNDRRSQVGRNRRA